MPKNTHTSASRTTAAGKRRQQEHHNKPNVDTTTSDKNSLELQKKSLNISGGRVFYERAASRRERHRNVLMASQDMVGAVPLGLGRRNHKKGGAAKGPGLAVDVTPVRQGEDDELVTKQLEMKAHRRLQIISQMRPSMRPNCKQKSSLPAQQRVSRKETRTHPSHPDSCRYAGTASTNNRDLERVQKRKSTLTNRGNSETSAAETRTKRRRQT